MQSQGRGRRLLKISYQDYPPKYDVTSGLNCAEQLVSQSEKMGLGGKRGAGVRGHGVRGPGVWKTRGLVENAGSGGKRGV